MFTGISCSIIVIKSQIEDFAWRILCCMYGDIAAICISHLKVTRNYQEILVNRKINYIIYCNGWRSKLLLLTSPTLRKLWLYKKSTRKKHKNQGYMNQTFFFKSLILTNMANIAIFCKSACCCNREIRSIRILTLLSVCCIPLFTVETKMHFLC